MKHFRISEFDSPDQKGSGENMKPEFREMIDHARTLAGVPFKVTSGFRTQEHHNSIYKKLGRKPTNSAHLRGYASDIAVSSGSNKYAILRACIMAGFNRIGIADSFIHVDCDPSLPQNVVWTY